MADKIPVRLNDAQTTLQEYAAGDTTPVAHGGTGADNAGSARTNLGAASNAALIAHVNDSNNPHTVTAGQVGAPDLTAFAALSQALANHEADTNNPHNVTAAETGAIPAAQKGAPSGVATLDATGKIPVGQIPAIAIPSFHVVPDLAARLALIVQEGDEALQLDNGQYFIFDGSAWHDKPGVNTVGGQVTTTTGQAVNTGALTPINFDTPIFLSGGGSQLSNSRVQIVEAGTYHIGYSLTAENFSNRRKTVRTVIRLNGGTLVQYTEATAYARNFTDDLLTCSNDFFMVLAAGDFIELMTERRGSAGFASLTSAQLNIDRRA